MDWKYTPERKDAWFRNGLIRSGITQAIYEEMGRNPYLFIIGEGSVPKTHFDAPQIERAYSDRLINFGISEDAGCNFTMGMSLVDNRIVPIYDIITADFSQRAIDSICNTISTTTHILGDKAGPILIRAEFLTFAPSTGFRPEVIFAHANNLKVLIPSTQIDAYYLTKEALTTKGASILFEDREIEDRKMKPEDKLDYPSHRQIKIGEAVVRKRGDMATVVSYAITAQRTESVLDSHPEWNVDFIDLVTIRPYDFQTIFSSVIKTRKLIVVEPDIVNWGIGAEIVAAISDAASRLNISIKTKRIGAPQHVIPATPALRDMIIPNTERIEHAIKEMLS